MAALAVVGLARVGVAPAEQCPVVTVDEARAATVAAVGWLDRNQHGDGTWAYVIDASGVELGGYSSVRHAGVLLSLEQAAAAGVDRAAQVAEAGWRWAASHLVDAGRGRALAAPGEDPPTGGTALLVRALLARDDRADDDLLRALGRFLVGQVLPSGAVSARWSLADDAPIAEARDRFFTGEALWALVGLADRFPDAAAVVEAATQVGAYVPVSDRVEDRFPPTSDHWAAYAYGDLRGRMTDAQREHAERLTGIVGFQVRGESTRWRDGLQGVIRQGPAVGSGLATLGEAAGGLVRALGEDGAPGMAERLRCTAGMLVERQDGGAWFTDGTSRMDDQQHAISALLAAEPVLAAGRAAVGGGHDRHPLLWLLAAGIVAANPFRPGTRRIPAIAALEIAAGALVGLSGPVLDALDVSPASARAAAGVALAVAAVVTAFRPAIGGGAAVGAALVLALSLGADDGARALVAVIVAAAVALAVPDSWRRPWAARTVAVVGLLLAADLVVDGVLGV